MWLLRIGLSGGDGGIRTLDTRLTYTPLAGERLQPLGHVSADENVGFQPLMQAGPADISPILGKTLGFPPARIGAGGFIAA